MKSSFVCLLVFALVHCRQALATGQGQGSPPSPPHFIDFFAKDGKSEQSSAAPIPTDQRGKQIREESPDLDLTLGTLGKDKHIEKRRALAAMRMRKLREKRRSIREGKGTTASSGGTSDRRYNKYRWQRDLENDAKVEEIYRIIGSKWRAMPRATLENSLDRANQYINKYPHLVVQLHGPALNWGVVEHIARENGPIRSTHRPINLEATRKRNDRHAMTIDEILQRRRARPKRVEGMTGYKEIRARTPKWAGNLGRQDRNKLVERLSDIWGTPKEVVKGRLYVMGPDLVQKHAAGVLHDKEEVYKEHAQHLLPPNSVPYVRQRGAYAAPLNHLSNVVTGQSQRSQQSQHGHGAKRGN